MAILFRRTNPKGELVVTVVDGAAVAMLTPPDGKPRNIGNKIVPVHTPAETPFGLVTHAIGGAAPMATTFAITEDEHELVAAVDDPEPLATSVQLVYVRNMADTDAVRGVRMSPDRWVNILGVPFWQHRKAVRAELMAAYDAIHSEVIAARVKAERVARENATKTSPVTTP